MKHEDAGFAQTLLDPSAARVPMSESKGDSKGDSKDVKHSLFGGAFSCSFPARFEDVSQFRQVPNHQEVFADASTDQSIIFEINEYSDVGDDKAAKHYFDDLAEVQEAVKAEVGSTGALSAEQMPYGHKDKLGRFFITGTLLVPKFKDSKDKANQVQCLIALVRLPQVKSDVLIVFNFPVKIADTSSSAGREVLSMDLNQSVIKSALATFNIESMSIFGGQEDMDESDDVGT